MKIDFEALHEDAQIARVTLVKAHVLQADDQKEAALMLASVLMTEAAFVLKGVYNGSEKLANEHLRLQFAGQIGR